MHIGVCQPSSSAVIAAAALTNATNNLAAVAAAGASSLAGGAGPFGNIARQTSGSVSLSSSRNSHHPFCGVAGDPVANSLPHPLLALHQNLTHLLPQTSTESHHHHHHNLHQPQQHHSHHNHHHHHHHRHHNQFLNYESQSNRGWRGSQRLQSRRSSHASQPGSLQTLLDLSAKVVAENIPFHAIEQKYEHIPEPVQRRIIFWSFPPNEDDIKMYSSLSSDQTPTLPLQTSQSLQQQQQQQQHQQQQIGSDVTNSTHSFQISAAFKNQQQHQKQLTYFKGHNLCNEGFVQDVLQVGFSLSGIVNVDHIPTNGKMVNNSSQPSVNDSNQSSSDSSSFLKSYKVSVTFDRCKITSVSCSCDFQDIFWCEHVVALILYRIRNPEIIDLRIPISETLLTLDRQQLQKLVQYIIAEHHTEVLPTAQRLLDEITQSSTSAINQYRGAPDPTAGCSDEVLLWHLDEQQVYEKTKRNLDLICSNANKEAYKHIFALFDKIKEMFGARDTNGTRLLKLITEQFLQFATRNDNKCRPLWDQLVSLWVIVMANPDICKTNRHDFNQILINWSKVAKCPKEDIERRVTYKRKASDMSDDDEADDLPNGQPLNGNLAIAYHQSNNYPAHMATHRHRAYQPGAGYPVLRPYNQIPLIPQTCSCQQQPSYPSFSKRMRCNQMQTTNESPSSSSASSSSFCVHRNVSRPSGSSSSNRDHARSNNNNNNENRSNQPQEPRSVFQRAVDISGLSWDDQHLQFILNNDGPVDHETSKMIYFDCCGYPLWNESLSLAAVRVLALKSHGYKDQALRLTVATIRRLKLLQEQWCPCAATESVYESSCLSRDLAFNEGWIGHPFDPTNVLFDILLDASTTPTINTSPSIVNNHSCRYSQSKCSYAYNTALSSLTSNPFGASLLSDLAQSAYNNQRFDFNTIQTLQSRITSRRAAGASSAQVSADKTTYYHVPVPGCCQRDSSYLSLAVELATMSLGQQRPMPTMQTAHERAVRQEAELIAKLENIDSSDTRLIEILKNQTTILLDGGPFHNSCCGQPADSAPLHTFARYLFDSLVSQHPQLAYKVGVYALRKPLTQEESGAENYAAARSRSTNYAHLQAEQLALAQTMLSKSKEESPAGFLRKVYKASVKNIRNASNLLKLSRQALKEAKPANNQTTYPALLKTSLDLGLQVLKVTVTPHTSNVKTRREAISFIVECVTELGLETVIQLMKDWREYFTPIEAVELIVGANNQTNLKNQALTKFKLKDEPAKEVELYRKSRDLVLECASRDPTNCALDALKFCEGDEESLKRALNIVIDAGIGGSMDSTQLIKVADHIHDRADHVHDRNLTKKAFDIALVAVDSLSIHSMVENSAAKKDIFRACEFAREINEFSKLIPKLIKNVECAAVLSEIYHTFKPANPVAPDYRRFSQETNQFLHNHHQHHSVYTPSNVTNYVTNEALQKYELYNKQQQTPEEIYWWNELLKTAIKAFETTTRLRLVNISPRHYGEFIDFLVKAQATFEKAQDGSQEFKLLILDIMKSYKTKKKLMEKLKGRFNFLVI